MRYAIRVSALLVSVWLMTGCMSLDLAEILNPPLVEQEISKKGFLASDKVVIIDISGEIGDREGTFSSSDTSPEDVVKVLKLLETDKSVKALLLRINSPGGEVSATDAIYDALTRFKKKTGVPVYASILSLGASGGYYVSLVADRIYAQPTSIVGSIGVIARLPNLKGLADKVGYTELIFKSGELKDMGHPLKTMPAKEKKVFQDIVDSSYTRFLKTIMAERSNFKDESVLRKVADGRVYTSEQALKHGLLDKIGYLNDAIDDLVVAAGLTKYRVVTYQTGTNRNPTMYSKAPTINLVNVDLKSLGGLRKPGLFYLWLPGTR